ncbi:PHD finger protein 3 [Geranomyces michiganensis]|nr:PHD finger protein 3 [Geranomyces michiganensis]
MNGDLGDLSTADLLDLEGVDWDAPSVLDVGNDHNSSMDLSNPLLSSDLMTGLSGSAPNDSALAWHSEHGLLDDLNALASTDMFPSHDSRDSEISKSAGSAALYTDQQETSVEGVQAPDHSESEAIKESNSNSGRAGESHEENGDTEEGSEHESQAPKGMVTSTPVVERRATREKAHVNYKALLDGPSITRKLVPPKKPAHNEKGQRKKEPPAEITQCLHKACTNRPGIEPDAKPGFCSDACYDAERSRLTMLAAKLAAYSSKNPKSSPTYPPAKCEHGPCTNARAAGSVFCGAACVAWCPPDPNMVAMLATTSAIQAPRVPQPAPPVELNKYRQNAVNGFVTTFEKIFKEAQETPAIYGLDVPPVPGEEDEGQRVDLNDVKGFCLKLEQALFDSWAAVPPHGKTKEVGEPYKQKYRSLQFNLKDVENVRLRRDVLKGTTTPAELVNLSSEELGNDAVRATIEAVRRKSLRDSVRAAEHHEQSSTGFIRKTHKGEVEVVPVGEEDNAVWGSHPVSMFGGWRDRDVVESPRTDEAPHSALSEKREGSADDGPKAKKVKFDSGEDNSDNSMDGVSHGAVAAEEDTSGGEADGTSDSVPMPSNVSAAGGTEEPPSAELVLEGDAAADHYGYEEYESIDARAQTPPGSPPPPEEPIDPSATIWTGRVHMPVVGRFQGHATQTHGVLIGTPRTWEDLLPATVTIDGRLPPSAVEQYLRESRAVGGKQVVAVRFEPGESEEDRAGYATVFDYFASRTRAAVVGHHYVSIKDMYILPVRASAEIPAFLTELGGLGDAAAMEIADRDSLYGVIILCKGFGSPAIHHEVPMRDRKREQQIQQHQLHHRQPSPPPLTATAVRLSTPTASLPPPPFPAAMTPAPTLPAFPAAPGLLDAFASPITPATGNNSSLLQNLLANRDHFNMITGLLTQMSNSGGAGNNGQGMLPADLASLLSTMPAPNLLPGVLPVAAPAAAAATPVGGPRMHPSRAAHAGMQGEHDQHHGGGGGARPQDGPPGKKTRWQ